MATDAKPKVTLEDMRQILGMGITGGPTGKELGKAKVEDDGKVAVYDTTIKALSDELIETTKSTMQPAIAKTIAELTKRESVDLNKKLQKQLDETETKLLDLANTVRTVEVKTPRGRKTLKGVNHNQFENLLVIMESGLPALLVGPAGTGKTHAAAQAADVLDLAFHTISVGSQTSKSDLVGYLDANHNYVRTQFREAYEHGGVFLLDEADAGNSNVLILLNAALSNGRMAFPDAMIAMHDDFRMVATANTYGHGASRQYVGRNQLDAATLDRFVVLNWDIDDRVEERLAGEHTKWLATVRAVRKRVVEELELRVVVSPRATQRGAKLLSAGMKFEDVLPIALTGNMPASERTGLEHLARTVYNKK